ncbi:MAG: hypothetical protein QOD99_1551 [Chthoniobacter sp.]|jgi:prepilin-type processing-associated H-X9-DG protein/prepilin-type N-terminal cleavage/methylation domain-containing protein|nr:hypothetical protein [Chthoniobacter sp.]
MQPPAKIFSRSKQPTAFTLIELLVVIVIIAILASLIFPALSTMQGKANQSKCNQNLRQWGMAIIAYSNDHNGQVQWQGWASLGASANYYDKYFGSSVTIAGTTKTSTEYFRMCPALANQWKPGTGVPVQYAFTRASEIQPNGSYGLISNQGYFSLLKATHPSQLLLMIDAITNTGANNSGTADLDTNVKPICTIKTQMRHSGGVNALFADGHVDFFQWTAIDRDTPAEQTMVDQWFHLD